jgi:adenylate kinase family enzyme
LVNFYGKAGILRTIDGMAEISQVTSQIAKLLEGI